MWRYLLSSLVLIGTLTNAVWCFEYVPERDAGRAPYDLTLGHDDGVKSLVDRVVHAAANFHAEGDLHAEGNRPAEGTVHAQGNRPVDDILPAEENSRVGANGHTENPRFDPLETWITPARLSSSAQIFVTMALIGLIPALLLMTTSYVRVVVVLGLLRQAFGAQQLLPAQVTTAIAMFITVLVMWPTWEQVYDDAVQPVMSGDADIEWETTWQAAVQPIRGFMSQQIKAAGNEADVWLFLDHVPNLEQEPNDWADVPLQALLPAFMLSELKTAFLIGFRIYLPFLVIDLLVSAITTSMGMFMLPPTMISMPVKLMLFVIVDGWHLIVGMLIDSFQTFS